jgi:flagellar basal body rod protein FlgC
LNGPKGAVPIKIKINFARLLNKAIVKLDDGYSSDQATNADDDSDDDSDSYDSDSDDDSDLSSENPSLKSLTDFPRVLGDVSGVKAGDHVPKKHKRGRKKSEASVKRQKVSGHQRRTKSRQEKHAKEKAEAKEKPSNYCPKPYMEKFVEGTEPVWVKYDASNLSASKSGYVGLKGKKHSKVKMLDELADPKSKTKYRLIEWQGRYVTYVPNPSTPTL